MRSFRWLFAVVFVVVVVVVLGMTGCSRVRPGHVGIKVSNFGGDAGISPQALPVGWYFTMFGTHIYEYPVYTNTYTWTQNTNEQSAANEEISFQDRNGLGLTADVAVAYHVDPTRAPILFVKYRSDMSGIVAGPLHNAVRNAIVNVASNMGVEEIYGPKKAALANMALANVQKYFSQYGLVVDQLYWASNIRLPAPVLAQINKKIANEQAALAAIANVQTVKANADAAAAEAEGKARSTQIEGDAIRANPEIMKMRAIERWNGTLPSYMGSGAPIPFLDAK